MIIKTVDGGTTWTQQYTCQDDITLSSVFFSDNDHGWSVGSKGLILKTDDGGQSWESKIYDDDNLLKVVAFSDSNNGFIFGINGMFLHTTDGGSTWQRQYGASPPLFINALQLFQGQTGYVLADGNRLLKLKSNIIPPAKGDINKDGIIDFTDLIWGLRIICGFYFSVVSHADVNNDEKIGLEEVIFILQSMSETN